MTYLHVTLVVEVGHVPAVLLVVVVVGVRTVVAGRDALSVGCRGSVVEVRSSAVSHLSPGAQADLLLLLGAGGSHADHPDEEDQQDEEDDGSSNAWSGKSSMKYLGSVLYCIVSPPAM